MPLTQKFRPTMGGFFPSGTSGSSHSSSLSSSSSTSLAVMTLIICICISPHSRCTLLMALAYRFLIVGVALAYRGSIRMTCPYAPSSARSAMGRSKKKLSFKTKPAPTPPLTHHHHHAPKGAFSSSLALPPLNDLKNLPPATPFTSAVIAKETSQKNSSGTMPTGTSSTKTCSSSPSDISNHCRSPPLPSIPVLKGFGSHSGAGTTTMSKRHWTPWLRVLPSPLSRSSSSFSEK
ncbi:hypothetical protein CPB84DRAFT_986359 [Gymnopilus junonius]|uniref:Uncharacterized protein n=1 Tax=Gymnopilus junonius TaxID=109634 RepID=A0A9P5NNG0_GYMJU|nr:hypothetical protein CPB84DRAFT_986359 [Gymnopilus junonius]